LLCPVLLAAASAPPVPMEKAPAAAAVQTPSADMFSESDAYERFMGRWSRQLATPFVAFAGVKAGDEVLDVGSGTGALSAAVLQANETGHVTGIDPSAAYVRYARAATKSDRAAFEEGDGQQMRFGAAAFDKTLSLLVMNFIPKPDRALAEMVRVTRPRGIVAAAVWDYGDGMEMLRLFWDEAVAFDPSSEPRDERHMPLCRQGQLAALWRQHSLTDVVEIPLEIQLAFSSFDDFWLPFEKGQGPAGTYVRSLPESGRVQLRERLRTRLGPKGAGAFTLKARAWAVKGRR